MRLLRPFLLLLALVAVAVPLSACGADDIADNLDPSAAVAEAADRTAGYEGMSFEMKIEVMGQEISGEGVVDSAGKKARMTMELPEIGEMESIVDGLVVYTKLPEELASEMPGGKPWLKLDLRDAPGGEGLEALMSQNTDPATQLRQLKAMGDIEEVGQEDVNGVSATHYSGTIDLRKVPDVLEGEEREAMRASVDELLKASGEDPISDVELWIDGESNVVRMVQSTPTPQGDVKVEMTFTDFGESVDIQPPPADETADMGALLEGAAG